MKWKIKVKKIKSQNAKVRVNSKNFSLRITQIKVKFIAEQFAQQKRLQVMWRVNLSKVGPLKRQALYQKKKITHRSLFVNF
jgi:hypothetical protein